MGIKNCPTCYFNYIIKIEDVDFDIMFHKVDGFIRDYDGTKYLVLIAPEKYDPIFDWWHTFAYLFIGLISGITYANFFNYSKIKLIQMMNLL